MLRRTVLQYGQRGLIMSKSTMMSVNNHNSMNTIVKRTMAIKAPCSDPLELLRQLSVKRHQCNEAGFRLPEVHWTVAVSFGADCAMKPPTLRSVSVQRVCDLGIDFVVKKGTRKSKAFNTGRPVSVMLQTGRYRTGESAEQWRGEGHCEAIPLSDILHVLPEYTISHMVASRRMELENTDASLKESTSHWTEIVQQVRKELEEKSLSTDDLATSIKAYRFIPDRMEFLSASPDRTLWDRWEWNRLASGDCPEGTIPWDEGTLLLPH